MTLWKILLVSRNFYFGVENLKLYSSQICDNILSRFFELPTDSLLRRRPYKRNIHLISTSMWRFVFVHSFFQLIICCVLLFNGEEWLGLEGAENMRLDADGEPDKVRLKTIIFNTFVWMQIFNEINARKVNGGNFISRLNLL